MVRKHLDTDADASRGQMLLIGALIITFSLIVLVLSLNNVLFVQNIESEGISAQAVETGETRQLVRQNTGEVLIRMNAGEFGSDTADYVDGNVSTMFDLVSNNSKAEHGTAITLTRIDTLDGTLVHQTDGGNFSNTTEGAQDWHLATAEDLRRFQLTVNRSSLNEPDSLSLGDLISDSDAPFYVNVSDGTDTWSVFIYKGGSSDEEIVVSTAENGGSAVEQYREQTTNATLALTTGRVNGEQAFEFAPNVAPPYEIRFGNGGAAEGNYTVTFNDTGTTINGTNVDVGGSTSPYSTEGVYAVDLTIEQTSVRGTYNGTLFVAPCRPGNDSCPRDIALGGGGGGSGGTGTNPGSNPPNPSIDSTSTTNTNGPQYDVTVDWEATDDKELGGGSVNEVRIVGDGNVEATKDISPSGTSDGGTVTFSGINSNQASNWEIVVEITDNDGNSVTVSQGVTLS